MEHAIILKPETLFQAGFLPITNTLLVSWIVIAILTLVSFLATKRIKAVPSGLQNFFELLIEAGSNTAEEITHSKSKALVFFPIVMTFFLFILTANILGLFPGFSTIGFHETHDGHHVFVPILRSMNSDLNMTLSLGLISILATHFFAVKYLGAKDYLLRWVSKNPILLFVGLLEIVLEFAKVLSLSLRLFGNIFAGEVVLNTVSGLVAFLIPLPFYFLEIIVAFIQATVFMMLTLVFMVMLTEKHQGESH